MSMEVKPGYKQTDVGVIPEEWDLKQAAMQQLLTGQTRLPGFEGEWKVKRLVDLLSRLANGAVYKPTNPLGLPITRIETISDGTIDYSRTGFAERTPDLEKYKLIPNDILFSHINSLDHIGKVALFVGEKELYHGMNLLLLRCNSDISLPSFPVKILLSLNAQDEIAASL